MSDGVTVNLADLGKLQTLLAGAANHAEQRMPAILDDVAQAVAADAASRAPVLSGELKASIGVLRAAGNKHYRSREIGSPLKQALFQEVGTSRHAPQPFLLPAARRGADVLYERVAELGDLW